jgi:hypothetical protein
MNNLPLYKVVLGENEDSGMFRISLVNRPAIEEGFITLSSEEEHSFKFANEEKKQVVGPIMIPDMPIYRRSAVMGEYNIVFPKETIEKIMYKYSKSGLFNSFNIEHAIETKDVTMLEVWMKEAEQDKSNAYGYNLPIGTVFVKAQIESEQLWEEIKSNQLNGFSIEIKTDIVEHKLNNEMDFKFAVELGERIAKLEATIAKISDDQLAIMELLSENQEQLAQTEESSEVVEEEVVEMSTEEPVAQEAQEVVEGVNEVEEVVFSEETPMVEEVVEEKFSAENQESEENSVLEAELALSAEQEGVEPSNEVAEDKTRSFERITSEKVNMIDKFFGKRFY